MPGTTSGIRASEDLGINPKARSHNLLLLSTSFRKICVLRDLREEAMFNPKVITSLIKNFHVFITIYWERENTFASKILSIIPHINNR